MSSASHEPVKDSGHPLLYASLTPINSTRDIPRIDLYRPKTRYIIGRNPQSDIVLDSERFDWSFCALLWDGQEEVRIQDLSSSNGIWVNRRRLAPGGTRILQDGDLVFLTMCLIGKPTEEEDIESTLYVPGNDHAYTYHQYTNRPPPLLPPQRDIWDRLDGLRCTRQRIDDELEKLRRERDVVVSEEQTILAELPEPPSFVRSALADDLQKTIDDWENIRKSVPAEIKLPEDFSELCRPDTDDLPYSAQWRRAYTTRTLAFPPPLEWGPPVGGWTQINHRHGCPDWNNPDLVWGGIVFLDHSLPLTIPPSIIYWSAKHKLPVYAHPRFDPDSTRTYARPYAQSSDGFSDYSAALQRRDLKLPTLDDPPIVRPRDVLFSLGCQWCPDEDVLAEKVASLLPTLRPDDMRLPDPVPEREASPEPRTFDEVAAMFKDSPYFHYYPDADSTKRKRDGEEDAVESDTLASVTLHPSPTAVGAASRDGLPSSPKRRKVTVPTSPPPHMGDGSTPSTEVVGVAGETALVISSNPYAVRLSTPLEDAW